MYQSQYYIAILFPFRVPFNPCSVFWRIVTYHPLKITDSLFHIWKGLFSSKPLSWEPISPAWNINNLINTYIREVFIPEYASNFNKELSALDTKFYGKIHFDRSRSDNELNMHCHLIVSKKTNPIKRSYHRLPITKAPREG